MFKRLGRRSPFFGTHFLGRAIFQDPNFWPWRFSGTELPSSRQSQRFRTWVLHAGLPDPEWTFVGIDANLPRCRVKPMDASPLPHPGTPPFSPVVPLRTADSDAEAEGDELAKLLAAFSTCDIPTIEMSVPMPEWALQDTSQQGEDFDHVAAAAEAGAYSTKKPVKKATKIEREIRVATVGQCLRRGWSRQKIVQYAAMKWGVRARQTDTYLALAHGQTARWLAKNRSRMEAHFLNQLDEAFSMAREANKPLTMIAAVEAAAKILGLYQPVAQRHGFSGLMGSL